MDISSPPPTQTLHLRDIDIGFTTGVIRNFTLKDEDKFDEKADSLHIVTISPPEAVVIYKHSLAFVSYRERTVKVPIKATIDAVTAESKGAA